MNTLKELKVGESLKEEQLDPVSRIDLIKYAGASGDFNPIHTIDEEATKTGLPGIIAHGMWTMGNLGKLFTPYYDEGFIAYYQIRFSGMVFLNDVLTLQAEVEESTNEYVIFHVQAVNQKDKSVVKGKVKISLY